MNTDAPPYDPILRPDFSHRVVRRVQKIKRRRKLYRRALTSALGCALVITAVFFLPARELVPPSDLSAPRRDGHSDLIDSANDLRELEANSAPFGQPLAFFFPGSTAAANLQSTEATYWHSYDPWWNPRATLDSPVGSQAQPE